MIALIVLVHCVVIGAFRFHPVEPLLSGAMQLASAITAAACCFRAGKHRDFARPFWLLLGTTFALWSAGQAFYVFNQYFLLSPNLLPNGLLFVFFISTLPLSIAVLARGSEFEEAPAWLRWFDGAQVIGLIIAACLLNFDLARGKNGMPQIEIRLMTVHARNLILGVALLVRALITKGAVRRLYAPVCFAFCVFTLSSWFGNQALEMRGAHAGQWWDLCWSGPFALMAVAASQWSFQHGTSYKPRSLSPTQVSEPPIAPFAPHITEYLYPLALCLSIVMIALQGMNAQRNIAVALVVASVLCFFVRSSFLQCHRAKLLIQMHRILEKSKRLTGYLPLCAACKMIRDDAGTWRHLESYIREYTEAEFTHGICPDCIHRLYPECSSKENSLPL